MKKLLTVALFLAAPSVQAQTYTQMQWGTDRSVNPYNFGANINGAWSNLGTVSSTGVWTLAPSAINVTGNISAGSIKTNTSLNSLLSTSLGPGGLNWIRYGSTTSANYNHFQNTGNHGYILAADAAIINSPGSGTDGPGYAESGILVSAQKDNYLTSSVAGELDSINCITTQNKKGDAACLLANVTKVRSGSGDTGGALGAEFGTYMINPSGTTLFEVHNIPAFVEGTSGVSGGRGYGSWIESWKGTNFAGVYVGNILSSDPNTGWIYAFAAANDRTNSNWYFRVIGDKYSGVNRPGDIIMGYPVTAKTLRNNAGTFQIRNTADDTTLFGVDDSGAATISSSLTIGSNAAATGNLDLANGNASGATVTVQNNAATSAYNFNLPATAGTSSYLLTSAGGTSSAMTWTSPTVTVNGTGCTLGSTCTISTASAAFPLTVSGTVTSGGIPYFNSATQMSSSALLDQYQLVVGGGAGAAPATLGATGSAGQHLQSNGAGANPSWTTATFPATTAAGTILASGTPNTVTATATPTLGVQSTTAGTLTLANTNVGAFPTTIASSASSSAAWTLTLPVATPAANGAVLTSTTGGVSSWASTLPVANGGTNCSIASITCFNNITGFTAAGTTGTTSTNLVFSTSPTLTTPDIGAATGTSLALGVALTSGQVATINGSSSTNGYFRAGSNAAPTNTTSGDITGGRLNIGDTINNTTYGALIAVTGNVSRPTNNFGMYFGPTITSASNITSAYGVISYPTVNMTGGGGSNTLTNNALFAATYAAAPTGTVTNTYGYWAQSGLVQTGATTVYGFECDMTSQYCFYNASTGATNIFAGKTRVGSTTAPTYALDVTGDTNTSGVFRSGGTAGITATKTVRDAAGTGTCTLIFTGGILTGGTC